MKSDRAIYTGFDFELDNFQASAIINTDLKLLADREQYCYAVFIALVPDRYDEEGRPTPEEYDFLNTIEHSLNFSMLHWFFPSHSYKLQDPYPLFH